MLGIRIQREEEWEHAAAGIGQQKYPWGDDKWNDGHTNFHRNVGRVTPVGLFPAGNTPEGISDLAGNVSEWTATPYDGYPEGTVYGVVGLFGDSDRMLRIERRLTLLPVRRDERLGFRCVRD